MTGDEGLRERSKARRRDLIERTAMRLFAENGYENTTIAEIAAAADVAPRTVSGYFPAKVDLATAYADGIATRITAAFGARPEAHLFDTLEAWLTSEADILDPELAALATAMYENNPELQAVSTAHVADAGALLENSLGRALDLSEDAPLFGLCKGALGATLAALIGQLGAAPLDERPELVRTGLAFMRVVVDGAGSAAARVTAR